MKDEIPPTIIPVSSTTTRTSTTVKKDNSDAGLFAKTRYKFWVLAAILLLAFWSMFTGSVNLKWSAANLTRFSDDHDSRIHDDLDILEVEERKKVVKQMWDVYTQSKSIRLPKFWQEAFEAAYESLTSDVPGVRDAAVSEIAKMSISSIKLDPPATHLQSTRGSKKRPKQAEKGEGVITVGSNR
ncbi:Sugar transporter, putative [Fagus crenata]